MTRTGIWMFGHSNCLGRELGSDMGLAAAYANVRIFDHNTAAGDPPSFVDDALRALSPRTHIVAGLAIGTAGPELAMGRAIDAARPNSWDIVKTAVDGSDWEDEWDNPSFPSGGGDDLLELCMDVVDTQMTAMGAALDITIPILGEADSNESPDASNVLTHLRSFRTRVRARYGNVGIVCYIPPSTYSGGSIATVRTQIATFVAETSRCVGVDTTGIPTSDGAHFTAAGYVTLGVLLADAIRSLTPNLNTTPFNITIGGSGSAPSFPVLSVATTAESIRDRAIAAIGALTPGSLFGTRYRKYQNEGKGDFVAWATEFPAAALRRFQVRESGDLGPDVSNTDYEERKLTLSITVAYPQNARSGPDQALDRDDIIEEDFKQIDYAIGIYGRANFSPPSYPDAMPTGLSKTIVKGDAVDFLVMEEVFTYQRSTS